MYIPGANKRLDVTGLVNMEDDGNFEDVYQSLQDSQMQSKNLVDQKQKTRENASKRAKLEWKAEHEQLFLDMYEDVYFEHCQQGNVSYDQWRVIASRFNEAIGLFVKYSSLMSKFDNFVRKYKTEKTEQEGTGRPPSNWKYYEQMHRIRGPSPKEQGIPRGLDSGYDGSDPVVNLVDLTSDDQGPQEFIPDEDFSFVETLNNVSSPPEGPVPVAAAEVPVEPTTTHRKKACNQLGVSGKPVSAKKKKSLPGDSANNMIQAMGQFTEMIREVHNKKAQQEDRRLDYMGQMLELR
ncbi:hypothetical protein R1sor_014911 [Riccia sorocarpa]|uniref:Myb/SANT-like DNA-binding domain-containing protein n=1 Tax=Riccia sorocarpa TaxID=122646 RepID=A0ABD3HDQ2_9MARC